MQKIRTFNILTKTIGTWQQNAPVKDKERIKMKKFNDLMSVSNKIENISASDAKKKLNDPNVQFIDVRDLSLIHI